MSQPKRPIISVEGTRILDEIYIASNSGITFQLTGKYLPPSYNSAEQDSDVVDPSAISAIKECKVVVAAGQKSKICCLD